MPFELLGSPLESWRSFMPEGMMLKSEPFASNLWDPQRRYTLRRYHAARGLHYEPVGSPVIVYSPLALVVAHRSTAISSDSARRDGVT